MKTLVVTGASRGLGAHIAAAATREGWRVIGLARHVSGDASYEMHVCDVADPVQVDTVFKSLKKEDGLFGLINTAGIASMNLAMSTPPQTAQRIIATNLLGTIHCCAAMGRLLARQKQGRMVNFSTIAVRLGLKGEAVYVASKAGIEGFTRSFAREMADFGVTVNVVAPGPIGTDLIAKVPSASITDIVSRQIIQRQMEPADVWSIVSLLLDERAGGITGEVLHVGGA
jgi:3-oxoacyl-[acyl-carrier protein] reductase